VSALRPAVVVAALFTAAIAATPASAQSWRTLRAQHQRRSSDTLHVRVAYGAGKLAVDTAPSGMLFDVRMRYDASQFRPEQRYDSTTRTLRVGADSATMRLFSLNPRHVRFSSGDVARASDLVLGLPRGVPLDLDLDFGAADARLDLSGLWVDRLRLESGASETTVTFGTPNPRPMRELRVETGLAGVTLRQLGNANARSIVVGTSIGGADLDFSGAWTGDVSLDLHVVLGGTTLRVPRDVGVVLRLAKRFGGLDAEGFTERGGAYYSANYEHAARHLSVDGGATLGGVEIVWEGDSETP
jgi:hypothetical protein